VKADLLVPGLALWLSLAGPALAQPASEERPAPPPQAAAEAGKAPAVGLDSLLRLPSKPAPVEPRSGGVSRQEWQQRFAAARADVASAQQAIDQAQRELGELAGGGTSWQMSAPGAQAGTESAPVSFRLRQELRRQREELANAERRLTELEVEANLAGVPPEWIQPPEVSPAEAPVQEP
jgi:hypothetical protein